MGCYPRWSAVSPWKLLSSHHKIVRSMTAVRSRSVDKSGGANWVVGYCGTNCGVHVKKFLFDCLIVVEILSLIDGVLYAFSAWFPV